MNALLLLVISIIVFLIAYVTYGAWLTKKWGIDVNRKTPAHTKFDNTDYVPSNSKVLLGHHFSSIAGAGPITGPILAAVFGWIPVYLWILVGSVFVGGVHDYSALFASIRHDGKTIGEIIKTNLGNKGKILYNIFAWSTIVLIVAAFTDICASTFAYDPNNLIGAQAGTASILFIFISMIFGFAVYRKGANLGISTLIGVILLFFCIWLGYMFPFIKLTKLQWNIVLIIYITLASTLPVWILLQPRDYLCSFLLYAMIIGGVLGILIYRPSMAIPAFSGFKVNNQTLFPFLFVTVACGAVSGFHSLIGSGTSSKQIDKESDAKLIGYGSMLIEGIVAIIALITVGYLANSEGAPSVVFANGLSVFMNSFGLPLQIGKVFTMLTFSAFALTSLDTATRIGRYIFQEFFNKEKESKSLGSNKYFATFVTIGASILLLAYGYNKIWPIFGAANQLLAALSLLAVSAWLSSIGKKYTMALIPMIFMFIVTLTSLTMLIRQYFTAATLNVVLGVFAVILLILALVLLIETYRVIIKKKKA